MRPSLSYEKQLHSLGSYDILGFIRFRKETEERKTDIDFRRQTMSGKYERKKSKKSGSKMALIVVIVILVLLLAAVAAIVIYYNTMLGKMNHVNVPKINYTEAVTEPTKTETLPEPPTEALVTETTVPPTQPHVASQDDYINILVVGQAARGGEEERFADTMILFTVNTYEKSITMTSFLRDTLVKPPDYKGHTFGRIKLTTVYHMGSFYGGGVENSMELMNLTLYNNFGVEVDHNFEIDFDAFVHVIDELGGVDIELTQAEADYLNADDFWVYEDVEPGMNTLNGMTALSYARMRKAEGDSDSDIVRTSRQRKLVESLIAKLKTKSPSRLQKIANKVLPLVTTSMTNSEITDLLLTLAPMVSELTIEQGGTCPAESWGEMVDIYGDGMLHSVLRFEEDKTKAYMRERTLGEVAAN